MDVFGILVSRSEANLGEVLTLMNIDAVRASRLTREYVESSYVYQESPQQLVAITGEPETPIRLIKFDIVAAAGFLASLVAGVVGANNAIVLGAAIVSSAASITGLIRKTSRAQGALFWALYSQDQHEATRAVAQQRFNELAQVSGEFASEDFYAALQGLIDLDVVEERGDSLRMVEKLVVVWLRQ